jgi:hypothetical protein
MTAETRHTIETGAPGVSMIAVLAAAIGSLGSTRTLDDCLIIDWRSDRQFTSVWKRREGRYGVSFRAPDSPEGTHREYYLTAWDAAEAAHLGHHTEKTISALGCAGYTTAPGSEQPAIKEG